jgi:hypothetical protein
MAAVVQIFEILHWHEICCGSFEVALELPAGPLDPWRGVDMPMPTVLRMMLLTAFLVAFVAVAAPARAALVGGGPVAGAVQAGSGARQPAPGAGTSCEGCAATLGSAQPRSPTRSVNLAILVLGSLWLTLMVRRIQMRAAEDGLRSGARPHAAGGH